MTAIEPVTSLELAPSVWWTDVQPVTPHRLVIWKHCAP